MGSSQKSLPTVGRNVTVGDPRPPLPIFHHRLNVTIILGGRGVQHRMANIAKLFQAHTSKWLASSSAEVLQEMLSKHP